MNSDAPAGGSGGFWARGHRPFFLGAGAAGLGLMGWWATILAGYGLGYDFMHGALWHGHEMLFGYTVAVLSGFLATGTRGTRLVALATIWVAGRLVVAASPVLPAWMPQNVFSFSIDVFL